MPVQNVPLFVKKPEKPKKEGEKGGPGKVFAGIFQILLGLLVLIIFGAIARMAFCAAENRVFFRKIHTLSPAFRPIHCANPPKLNFYTDDPPEIVINFTEGCYNYNITVPWAWGEQYDTGKSTNPGDYGSVWCNGYPHPGGILWEDTPVMSTSTGTCHASDEKVDHFSIQGKGTLTLRPRPGTRRLGIPPPLPPQYQ